jgi:hypothetical protein
MREKLFLASAVEICNKTRLQRPSVSQQSYRGSFASKEDTVVLPHAMPPVKPTGWKAAPTLSPILKQRSLHKNTAHIIMAVSLLASLPYSNVRILSTTLAVDVGLIQQCSRNTNTLRESMATAQHISMLCNGTSSDSHPHPMPRLNPVPPRAAYRRNKRLIRQIEVCSARYPTANPITGTTANRAATAHGGGSS